MLAWIISTTDHWAAQVYKAEKPNAMIRRATDENALEIDFGAFDFSIPHLTLNSSIGNGLSYVSKFMTSKLSGVSENAKPLVDYLLALNHQGEVWK